MKPYYQQDGITIYHGDCRDVAPELSGVTAVVTDPPYGLSFMGKDWDHGVPGCHFWELIKQACLPGAMLLAFGGTRTYHRLTCAIEDAGFEIRDCIQWIYGSGFPKSLDISKAIDKAAGAEREVVGRTTRGPHHEGGTSYQMSKNGMPGIQDITTPSTEHAKTWDGYGTALKPAHEPICVAMKPLDGTYAQNAIEHGVAGINVDGCRVGTTVETWPASRSYDKQKMAKPHSDANFENHETQSTGEAPNGRWPANIIHDGSYEVVRLFPETTSGSIKPHHQRTTTKTKNAYGERAAPPEETFGDSGSAARFFYCAKASDREIQPQEDFPLWGESYEAVKNTHPTVKPIALMSYLVRLVTMPERNLILDPFAGSGTTLVAAKMAGVPSIGIELDEKHCEIIANRLSK